VYIWPEPAQFIRAETTNYPRLEDAWNAIKTDLALLPDEDLAKIIESVEEFGVITSSSAFLEVPVIEAYYFLEGTTVDVVYVKSRSS